MYLNFIHTHTHTHTYNVSLSYNWGNFIRVTHFLNHWFPLDLMIKKKTSVMSLSYKILFLKINKKSLNSLSLSLSLSHLPRPPWSPPMDAYNWQSQIEALPPITQNKKGVPRYHIYIVMVFLWQVDNTLTFPAYKVTFIEDSKEHVKEQSIS